MADRPQIGKKNIIVTGGAGFIGSFLCEKLLKEARVICIDDFSTSSVANIEHLLKNPDFELLRHDLAEPLDLLAQPELERFKIAALGVQEIYHLACPMVVKSFMEERERILDANSVVMRNVLKLAAKYRAKFLLSSSSVVYGARPSDRHQCREEDAHAVSHLTSRACYDEGRRWSETMAFTYKELHGLDIRIARVFRTFGPRMPLDDGHMIPDFVRAALDGRDVVVHGDAKFRSSFCYVTDVVDGLVRLMGLNADPGPVNLGSDEDFTVSDVAKHIVRLLGSESKIVSGPPLVFLSELGIPDLTRAKEALGWFPIVPFLQGLKKTIEYSLSARGEVRPLNDV